MTNGHDLNQSLGTPEALKHHAWLSLLSSRSIHPAAAYRHCHNIDMTVWCWDTS